MTLTLGMIKADIIAAKQAIDYFEKRQIKNIKNVAAYHLQQAAEKMIKYQIYQAVSNINNRQMYTHDLSKLKDYAESEGLTLIIPEYIDDHLNSISDWEVGSRYDIGFSIRIDILKKCYEVVEKWEKQLQGIRKQ